MAARRQDPYELHWKPVVARRDRVYGGGIQYGKCFETACNTCPPGSYPMCISLHWDGTNEHRGLASTPICVGVANCNNSDVSTQHCLGYMPKVPDNDNPQFNKTPKATRLKFFIRQQCVGAVLQVMARVQDQGVECSLKNGHGVEVRRLLMPRLCAINLDQPEAQLFFGMLNRTCCSKCKWRKGYSAFRNGSTQNGDAVRLLYSLARRGGESGTPSNEKLARWGFNPERYCCLHDQCGNLIVRIPGLSEVVHAHT